MVVTGQVYMGELRDGKDGYWILALFANTPNGTRGAVSLPGKGSRGSGACHCLSKHLLPYQVR